MTFERPRYAFLPTGDVEARGGNRIVTSPLHRLALVNLLEQRVTAVLRRHAPTVTATGPHRFLRKLVGVQFWPSSHDYSRP